MHKYKTIIKVIDQKVFAFYKYQNIGLVPCEISFVYRNKTYSTIGIMNLLAKINRSRTKNLYFQPLEFNDWFNDKLRFNKHKFVEMFNKLQTIINART